MPPSLFSPDTTWTGTQILLSEQHCGNMPAFSLLILCSNDAHDGSDLLRTGKFGRSVGGNKTVTAVWFQ